ncbi:hypothetical protein [Actinomadura bangladeshensis]|uniref:Uncharacterized protein n=1 Tax=Actinomadura bangladeshensis TaxID=453573 RepID=A0A6L9QBT6_9ACTN|nr:hypothetical protein [Actinomadura bangladeshensis]NEA21558.1 hypothetical protein [Actinomadura bangladeshensis]NEA22518.1 hypothetical protein [Actinomadura bangladeshensis]
MNDVQELALTESRTLRDQYAGRTDVLDKVKALSLLPDGVHADMPTVAAYFEVPPEAIESVVRRNREELAFNGLRVLRGAEYRDFATVNLTDANPRARSVTLFTRRTILNVGQMLTESHIAQAVRTYLLDVEEAAGPEARNEAIERAAVSRAQITLLKAADGLLDPAWLKAKAKVVIARGLGETPDINPLDVPLYVPNYLQDKGLNKKQVESEQSWFGRRVVKCCQEDGVEPPDLRPSETAGGQIRETRAWTKRHLPYFEAVWDRWYAARYAPQGELDLFDGGV